MVGKWHLGHADRKYWPQNRGFDHFYGNLVGEVDYFTKERGGIIDWQRDGKFLKEDGYFTTLIGNEAVNIIKTHDTSKPLFLYVRVACATRAVSSAPGGHRRLQECVPETCIGTLMTAMITDLDTQVGRVVAALEAKGYARQHHSSSSAATTAAPQAHCLQPERGRRKSARKAAAWSLAQRHPPRTVSFAAARVRCTKAA